MLDIRSYDHIIIALSGGKDSLACLLHLLDLRVDPKKIEIWHHLVDGNEGSTLMDWACTSGYCRALAKAFNLPIYFSWLEGGFEREMLRDNTSKACSWFETPTGLCKAGGASGKLGTRLKFPQLSASLTTRWCSAYLKVDVCSIAIANQPRFIGKRILVVSGERGEESANRAKYAVLEPDRTHCDTRHVDRFRPILHWSSEQVWALIKKHLINPHPAYRLGFGRVSCQFCIFGSDNQWATLYLIDPERVERIARYEEQFNITIHRSMTVMERVQRGTPYPLLNLLDINAALEPKFSEPIFLPKKRWLLPSGAYGEACGSP